MSYIRTNWKDGDTITAAKLNNITSHLAPLVAVEDENGLLNVSYADIRDAILDGRLVFLYSEESGSETYNMLQTMSENTSTNREVLFWGETAGEPAEIVCYSDSDDGTLRRFIEPV